MKTRILITAFLMSFGILMAQKDLRKADEYFENFDFKNAAVLYEKAASESRNPGNELIGKLALSYFNLSDYTNARMWYDRLYEGKEGNLTESTFIRYVQSLKSSNDPLLADALIKNHYQDNLARLQMIAAQKKHLEESGNLEFLYEVYNLDINSNKSDFAPMYFKDQIVFASSRDTIQAKHKLYTWNHQPYLDIYVAERDKSNGDLEKPEKFLENLESDYHDATIAFCKENHFVYFARNYYKRNKLMTNNDGISNVQILKGLIEGNKLVSVEPLHFNSLEYSCAHPVLSPDNKYLYFVSDMPGGYGETDIYRAELLPNGKTKDPVNLGTTINTSGREMFPYIGADNVLYFASDGHYGLGGLDIFESNITEDSTFTTNASSQQMLPGRVHFTYSLPLNLGTPVNSNMDDFAFIIDTVGISGYFSSNRANGKGDDDLYSYRKKRSRTVQSYSGKVLDKKTNKPIPSATVQVFDVLNALVTSFATDEEGNYSVELDCKSQHTLIFSKDDYSRKEVMVTTSDVPNLELKDNFVYLTPFGSLVEKEGDVEKISVEPIYFDFDRSDITDQAIRELDKVIFAMTEFPNIKIKIESHTDARGRDAYNLSLSDRRAKATKDYLIFRGIDASRIESAIGYGESRLKNKCYNGINCSEEEHLENRRSDFIIIEK